MHPLISWKAVMVLHPVDFSAELNCLGRFALDDGGARRLELYGWRTDAAGEAGRDNMVHTVSLPPEVGQALHEATWTMAGKQEWWLAGYERVECPDCDELSVDDCRICDRKGRLLMKRAEY
jgi:hypothetical protein